MFPLKQTGLPTRNSTNLLPTYTVLQHRYTSLQLKTMSLSQLQKIILHEQSPTGHLHRYSLQKKAPQRAKQAASQQTQYPSLRQRLHLHKLMLSQSATQAFSINSRCQRRLLKLLLCTQSYSTEVSELIFHRPSSQCSFHTHTRSSIRLSFPIYA